MTSIYDHSTSIRARPYWEGIEQGELRYQECTACTHRWISARDACARCQGEPAWKAAGGDATVYSFSVVRRGPSADMKDKVPYTIALVQLAEGPRLLTWIVETPPEDVQLDMPVKLTFGIGPGGYQLPFFKPA